MGRLGIGPVFRGIVGGGGRFGRPSGFSCREVGEVVMSRDGGCFGKEGRLGGPSVGFGRPSDA